MSLREEISNYVARLFGPVYRPDNEILITVGVSEALTSTARPNRSGRRSDLSRTLLCELLAFHRAGPRCGRAGGMSGGGTI